MQGREAGRTAGCTPVFARELPGARLPKEGATTKQATGRLNFLVVFRPAPWTVRPGSGSPAMASPAGMGQGPGGQMCLQPPNPSVPTGLQLFPGEGRGHMEVSADPQGGLAPASVSHPNPVTGTQGSHGPTCSHPHQCWCPRRGGKSHPGALPSLTQALPGSGDLQVLSET